MEKNKDFKILDVFLENIFKIIDGYILSSFFFLLIPGVTIIFMTYNKFLNLNVRYLGLVSIILTNLIFIFMYILYNKEIGGYQFKSTLKFNKFIGIELGIDELSLPLIGLTLILMLICNLLGYKIGFDYEQYYKYLKILELFILMLLLVMDIITFFFFFELTLIPIFLIILRWGSKERKIYAAKYFFILTFFGSLFMLTGIFYILAKYNVIGFVSLSNIKFTVEEQKWLFLLFFFTFAIKIPIFPFHMWLPEAHVEAPTTGSVLLAGILLKLGFYGLIRISFNFFFEGVIYFLPLINILLIIGVIYSSLSTLVQIDLKKIIAYSSVAHMNFALLGLFNLTLEGFIGSYYLMISHGLISSALFICIGILYDRYKTRIIFYYGGITLVMPLFSIYFFIFILSNMSVPLSSNFVGEFLVFISMVENNKISLIISSLTIVLGGVYSLWLYNRVCFGTLTKNIKQFSDINRLEFNVLNILMGLNVFLGLYPYVLIEIFKV